MIIDINPVIYLPSLEASRIGNRGSGVMPVILENILIMILTIVVLLGGGYLVLLLLHWGLKIKSGGREEQGLTDLWIAQQRKSRQPASFKQGAADDQ